MAYKLIVNNKEIEHVSGLEWSDNLEDCANIFNFSSDERFEAGSQFAFFDGKELVIQGVITQIKQQKAGLYTYTGYDFGFYLNKNSIVKQFRTPVNIADAFEILCREYAIPYEKMPQINATVKDIYKNRVLASVFKELLEIANAKIGKKYYFTCVKGKFELKQYEYREDCVFKLSDYYYTSSFNTLNNPDITISMEDLKNQVMVVNSGDKLVKKHIEKDLNNIKQYGLLQGVEVIDADKNNNLMRLALNKLSELNRLKTTISLSMLGDYRLRKGTIIPIKNKELGLDGNYLIKSSVHTIDSNKENINVVLEQV